MVDSWSDRARRQQRVLNARPIPARRAQRSLHPEPAVRVRVLWEHDGEEWIETVATAYTTKVALVQLQDGRHPPSGCGWIQAT